MVGKFTIQEEVSSRVELEQGRPHLNVFTEVGKRGKKRDKERKKERERERERRMKERNSRQLYRGYCVTLRARYERRGSISLPDPKTRIF